MKLATPSVSVDSSPQAIALAIENCRHGVLTVTGFPRPPFDEILSTFDQLSNDKAFTDRLNEAYPKNLVYKDAFANGKGGDNIDKKRVLDLSPDRLEEMKKRDLELVESVENEGSLALTMAFWERLRSEFAPKIIEAVAQAIGSPDVLADSAFNYRMVDYYERSATSTPPRCGEHRDFGSFTLVFPSHSGLQILAGNEWKDIQVPNLGDAVLLFGWCTQIRSNGRIPAALHRVTHKQQVAANQKGMIPRRASAVLFCAPKQPTTPLEPVVRPGEEPKYIGGIQAGQLRGAMALKWQMREGTIRPEDLIKEEAEILATNMRTQDDVVQKTVAAST